MKNKIVITIFVLITMNTVCMEKDALVKSKNLVTASALLEEDGKILKELITHEARGQFSPKLLEAEKTLLQFFEACSLKSIEAIYTNETIKVAQGIAQRPNDRKKLISLIEDDNHYKLEEIIRSKNPFTLHAYDTE